METQTGKVVKIVRSDSKGKFLGAGFRSWLTQKVVKQELSAPEKPPQNGVAERLNRTPLS